jgi:hypothetical protein
LADRVGGKITPSPLANSIVEVDFQCKTPSVRPFSDLRTVPQKTRADEQHYAALSSHSATAPQAKIGDLSPNERCTIIDLACCATNANG